MALRIGLDVDGVMYQWDKTARYMLRTEKGYPKDGPLGKESTGWNSIQEHVTKEDWNWLWNSGVKQGLFRYGHLYKGTIEAVRSLSKLGDVVVITHRPKSAVQDTLDWLSYLRLPFQEIHLLTSGEAKSQVKCSMYVDDKPENMVDYEENTDGLALLWERPWNMAFALEAPKYSAIGIVRSWEEVIHAARDLLAQG